MLRLPIDVRNALDERFAGLQTERTETPLVREYLREAPAAIRHVLEPHARIQGCEIVVGSLFCHGSPKVTWEGGRPPAGRRPELGDLLVVTAFVHRGTLASARARLFQAKTRATDIDDDQYWLYTNWPLFRIYAPSAPGYEWFLSAESPCWVPFGPRWPENPLRGTSYLWVDGGLSPVTTYVSRHDDHLFADGASLGWFLCDMLGGGAGREFTVSALQSSTPNDWDELVTYLLFRAKDVAARVRWDLPELPSAVRTGTPRPYTEALISELEGDPGRRLGHVLGSRSGNAGGRAVASASDAGEIEGADRDIPDEPNGGVLAVIVTSG